MEDAQNIIDERIRVENFEFMNDLDSPEHSHEDSPKQQHSPGKTSEAAVPFANLPTRKVKPDFIPNMKFGSKAAQS